MMDVVLSVGGSIIVPDAINVDFLKSFRSFVLDYIKDGSRVVIVTGGGKVCRRYQSAAKGVAEISSVDLDHIGIQATKLNAELVRSLFGSIAYKKVVYDPTSTIDTDKKVIVGSGWKPGCSTDKDTVLLADNLGIKTVVNMTNTDFVYDKNPKVYDDAKPLHDLSWDELLEITGKDWKPGMNAPFDPVAAKFAKDHGMEVVILRGTDLSNLEECLAGKEFVGTKVS